jgi:long-chain acyl-CoA synthetase
LSSLSSLERVELLADLESRHGIEIDEEAFSRVNNAADLATLVSKSGDASTHDVSPSRWATWFPMRWVRHALQSGLVIPLFRGLLSTTVIGLDHLAAVEPPVLFAANHASNLDAPAIFSALPFKWRNRLAPAMRANYFAGKSFQYFLAGLIFNGYLLPQEMEGVRRGLAATEDLVRRGYCPLVFPEGERTPDGRLRPFKPGIGMLAQRLRTPVIPVYLEGLYEIYSVHDSWPKRGAVRVVIGEPIQISRTASYEEAAEAVRLAIERASATPRP